MTRKRKTSLAISVAAACMAVLYAVGACNGIRKEEKAVQRMIVTTVATTSQTTEPVIATAPLTKTASTTTTAQTTVVTTIAPQITTTVTCSTTEKGLGEMPTPTTATEQTTAADNDCRSCYHNGSDICPAVQRTDKRGLHLCHRLRLDIQRGRWRRRLCQLRDVLQWQ